MASRRRFRASAELAEALLATGFPSRKRHASPNIHFYQEFTLRSHGVRRAGSAALDLAYVACGRMEAFWEFNLNPWDTAAGILLVEEAGGRVTDFSGAHFRLDSDEILASNGLIHEELIGLLRRHVRRARSVAHPYAAEFAERQGTSGNRNEGIEICCLAASFSLLVECARSVRLCSVPSFPAPCSFFPHGKTRMMGLQVSPRGRVLLSAT